MIWPKPFFADEVGLGTAFEAGLVLSQKWAQRFRRFDSVMTSIRRFPWQAWEKRLPRVDRRRESGFTNILLVGQRNV